MAVKPGEILREGRNVTIGAPQLKAAQAPSPSQAAGMMARHLKGAASAAEDLQRALEEEEKTEEKKPNAPELAPRDGTPTLPAPRPDDAPPAEH